MGVSGSKREGSALESSVEGTADPKFQIWETGKTFQFKGPIEQVGQRVQVVKVGTNKWFKCAGGLGRLFNRAGKPRGFPFPFTAIPSELDQRSHSEPKERTERAMARGNEREMARSWEIARRGEDEDRRRGRVGATWGGRGGDRGRGFAAGYGRNHGGYQRFGMPSRAGGRGPAGHRGNFGHFTGHGTNQERFGEGGHPSRIGWVQRKQKQEGEVEGKGDTKMEEAMEEEKGEEGGGSADIKCTRCTKKGHAATKCTTELYCVICDGHDHVNHRCPILKMPRPVAHAVGYAVHGLGFYHIQRPALTRQKKETKWALITVEGGELSKEQVQMQMHRLFPGKWKWEIEEKGVNSFITKFPSKSELQRSIAFGGADVWEDVVPVGIRLKFSLWFEKKEGYLLPKVWIRVFGMREELREFLDLWAVGSMLGSTQTVDMETTRKNDFGRIMVAVLNHKLIPRQLDAVIGDHYFELEFEVEKKGLDENGEEVEIDWCPEQEMEEENENFATNDGEGSVRDPKRRRGEAAGILDSKGSVQPGTLKELVQQMSEAEFNAFIRKKAEEILDSSVKQVLEETADKVLLEEDGEGNGNSLEGEVDRNIWEQTDNGVQRMILEEEDGKKERKHNKANQEGGERYRQKKCQQQLFMRQ